MNIINPAVSFILALFYSLLVSFSQFEIYFILPLFFILFIQKKYILKILIKLLFLNLFIFVLFLFLLFSSSFEDAINLYIRANVIILFNISLFFTSKGYDIVRGLSILNFPNKFVSSTYFTLKMIEFLTNDIRKVKGTLVSRGFKANSSIFTYQTFGNILGMLFVKSIRKADSLKDTFQSRGFSGSIYLNDEFKIKKIDFILTSLVCIIIIIKVYNELFI